MHQSSQLQQLKDRRTRTIYERSLNFSLTCNANDFINNRLLLFAVTLFQLQVLLIQALQVRVAEPDAIFVGVDGLVVAVVAQNFFVVSRQAEEETELRVRFQLQHFVLLQIQITRDFVKLLFDRYRDVIKFCPQL